MPNVSVQDALATRKVDSFKISIAAGHIADVIENLYSAYLVGENKILVVEPSTDRVFRQLSQDRASQARKFGMDNVHDDEERVIQQNAVANDRKRQMHLTLLEFSGDMVLTNEHLSPRSRGGLIDMSFYPVSHNYVLAGARKTMEHTSTVVSWKITVVPAKTAADRILSQQQGGDSNADRLSAMFASAMNVDSPGKKK